MGTWYGPEPSISPASISRGPISESAANSRFSASTEIVSFPMSRAFVTPAAICISPSSPGDTCTCMSQSPGISILPPASITVAPAGIFTFPSAPTAVMRSPFITTVIAGFTVADSAMKSRAPRITSAPVGLCDSSRARRT